MSEPGGSVAAARMGAFGASSSLRPIAAKVASPNRHRPLRLGRRQAERRHEGLRRPAAPPITGAASIGQGVETVLAQICADGLGTGLDRIRVIHGQTDRIARGMGAFASRVTVMTGAAVTIAAARLRSELLTVAGRLLQTAPDRLAVTGDRVVVCDAPGEPSLDFAAIARGAGGALTADATFTAEHMTYPYGVHLAQVRLERDSCAIAVERFFVGYDVGRAVNPMLVEGQFVGGAAQGIGAALLEEFVYDASGQPQSVLWPIT
jgi:aerobic carbon-monoxide dehydrogenase large subunit